MSPASKSLKNFSWSPWLSTLWTLLILLGAVSFGFAVYEHEEKRAWVNFLLNYVFWFSIGLSGVFFAALQHLTGSYWSVTVRRVAESFSAFLPCAFVLFFIFLLFGMSSLYEWLDPKAVQADKLLLMKSAYLNKNFFIVRHLALYTVIFLMGGWMIKNSIRQDQSGDLRLTRINVKIAAPFMLFFGWLFTFAIFDLVMSLQPHWFSTIFGIYCWAGLFYSGLGMLALWVVNLRKNGYLGDYVSEDHLHDIGKLMFTFMVFWAYIAFSQFVLIWYANMPEETVFFLNRARNHWKCLSYILIFFKFVLPFFILVSRPSKRNPKRMGIMGAWFVLAQYLDMYWLIFPVFYPENPVFGWIEIGIFAGFAGLFFKVVGVKLGQNSAVAVKDPRLELALHHSQ
ncbi:MAG: hypothetical protein HQM15_01955 [Deltaproteobacteria bacterium]|nr:hypothetical protein [Deltaproteobacteria bacterium]